MTLTPDGLTIKTTAEILTELEDALRAAGGAQIQVGDETPIGQALGIEAILGGTWQQQLRAVYDAMDPDNAAQAQLDNIAGQNGVVRDPARHSVVLLDITGTPATVIPAGSVYRIPDGARWETTAEATIPGGGTITDVPAQSEDTGAIAATPDTITEAVTIISGVSSITNPAAAIPGNAVEIDEALRQRREAGFSLASTATDGGLRSRLGELDSIEQVLVVSNRTSATVDGRPEHSFEAIVWPAQVDDIPVFQVVFDNQPSGIEPYGDITGEATDSTGASQPVAYSVASEIEVYFDLIVTTDGLEYGGDDAVEQAVIDFVDALRIGQDVFLVQVSCAVIASVTGLLDLEVRAKVGGAPGPSDVDNVAVGLTEIATTDAGKITVTPA